MKKMLDEFKKFAFGSNIFELATAVIFGGAVGKMVSALVDSVIMPIIGVLIGGRDFSSLSFTIGEASIKYGEFIQAVVDFLIISIFIFILSKTVNKINAKPAPTPEKPKAPTSEDYLKEIRDILADTKKN